MAEKEASPLPHGLGTADIVETTTIRLISTAFMDEPAMAPLADDGDDLDFLAEIERKTSVRQNEDLPLPADVRRRELLTQAAGYGWTYVNAAFCYTRPGGNRFNDERRGAWYAAWGRGAVDTAIAEVSYHLTRELENVGVFENSTDYRELVASFIGPFVDLRGREAEPWLDPDPSVGHPAGQRLARELRASGANGVVYPSPRREGGMCLAAFRTNLVQNIRQGATWRLTWRGERTPTVARA
ncbi:RES family NAD+ phosphorylase [Alteriqipengyuania sp. 357]